MTLYHHEIEVALHADRPSDALRNAVATELRAGRVDRDEAYERLGALLPELQAQGRERDEDVVLEVMDYVSGWCSPHMKL